MSTPNDEIALAPPKRRPFPKRTTQAEITSIEMTKSCARDLTNRIQTAVDDLAELLWRAHEGKAWQALGYESWTAYTKAEFQMSRPRSYQLLDFVEIRREIEESTMVDPPQNERQTRVLKSVPRESRVEVWEEATEKAAGPPTARQLTETAMELIDRPEYPSQEPSTTPEKPKISDGLRDEIADTISAALNQAWEKLGVIPEMDWQLFRSGVRAWLRRK